MFKYMFVPIRYINQREIICIVLFGREDINFEPFELLLYYIAARDNTLPHFNAYVPMYSGFFVVALLFFLMRKIASYNLVNF